MSLWGSLSKKTQPNLPQERKKKTYRGRRSRTTLTYQKKVSQLQSLYIKRKKTSEQSKKENLSQKKVYFCDKYPTFEDFLKVHKLKEANK